MTPVFNYGQENLKMHIWCKFGDSSSYPSYCKLLPGQANFPRILSKNDLKGQCQWPLFSIPVDSILGVMFGANLVITAQICGELLCWQGKVHRQTDGRTDRQMQAKTIPLQPERLRGKKNALFYWFNQITNLPQQLSCHDMCKIVTWLDR